MITLMKNYFFNLKNMYNKNYINPEEFKQIIIKYKDLKNQTKWSFEQEEILSEISEKSSLYHWLHRASYDYYIKQDNLFVYPLVYYKWYFKYVYTYWSYI